MKTMTLLLILMSSMAFAQKRTYRPVELKPRNSLLRESLESKEKNEKKISFKELASQRIEVAFAKIERWLQSVGFRFVSTKQVNTMVNFAKATDDSAALSNLKRVYDAATHENQYIRRDGLVRFDILFESSYIVDRLAANPKEAQQINEDKKSILNIAANTRYRTYLILESLKMRKSMAEIQAIYDSFPK
jgi:hypothetical protein